MEISKSFLIQLHNFVEKIKPEEEVPISINSQRIADDEILSLVISIEHPDRVISNNIINLHYCDDVIVVNKDTSFIKEKYLEDKIYGHEKEIYELFESEGRFLMTVDYKPRGNADMEIVYINNSQRFTEQFIISGNKVHVKTVVDQDIEVDFESEGGNIDD